MIGKLMYDRENRPRTRNYLLTLNTVRANNDFLREQLQWNERMHIPWQEAVQVLAEALVDLLDGTPTGFDGATIRRDDDGTWWRSVNEKPVSTTEFIVQHPEAVRIAWALCQGLAADHDVTANGVSLESVTAQYPYGR